MASSRVSGVRLDALWQHAREAVFVLNADRRLMYVNRAWEELTGFEAKSVLGVACRAQGPIEAGDPASLASSFCPPAEALNGVPAGGLTLIVHASGERRWRRVEFWPYHDGQKNLICLLGLVRDADAAPHAADAEGQRLRSELLEVRKRLLGRYGFDGLIGDGPGHRRLLEQVRAAAATTVPVLIAGEPGTGKRTVARTIHQQGPRAHDPLLTFDCGALPPEVIERELFRPFDDGISNRLASPPGSTLLLGDILDLPRDLQGRLTAALDDRVRLLAVTSGNLEEARLSDRLRTDLYYALTTMVIRLSPLRERLEELPLLAQHLLDRANLRGGRQPRGFTAEALAALTAHDWPGNLRELARVVDAAHAACEGDAIRADDLPRAIRGHLGAAHTPPTMPPQVTPLDELLTQVERRLIEQALARARQNKSRAAELLDISRPRLYRRIKELNIPDEPEPTEEAAGARKPAVATAGHAAGAPIGVEPSQS
jgi:PAS domain S-box-containing protein